MGDTSGDTDFWVSKNQNQGVSGMDSNGAASSASTTPAQALGSVARAEMNATISKVKVDRPGPQSPGSTILWTVEASNPGNEQILYDFLLSGPSSGGQFRDMTGWTNQSSWAWKTADADIGDNQIKVLVTRLGSAAFEDSRILAYRIAPNSTGNASSGSDAIPSSGQEQAALGSSDTLATASSSSISPTNDSDSNSTSTSSDSQTEGDADTDTTSRTAEYIMERPRTAPDETPRGQLDITGANMRVPDTSPTPLNSATPEVSEPEVATEAEVLPQEPQIADVEGKWTIRLEQAGISVNPLNLIQTGERVMGSGTLNDGGSKLQVSATGSVSGNAMSLRVWTVIAEFGNQIDKSIMLDLVKSEQTFSGSYELYSGEDLVGQGNATASRVPS